jgi:hypothetical protein
MEFKVTCATSAAMKQSTLADSDQFSFTVLTVQDECHYYCVVYCVTGEAHCLLY